MKSGRYFKPPGRGFPATAEGRAAFASSNEQHLDTSPKSCFTISWQFCLDASSIRWSKDSMCVGPARALGSPWCLSNGTRADSQGCWGWTFGTHAPKDPRLGWPRKWFCFSWRFFFEIFKIRIKSTSPKLTHDWSQCKRIPPIMAILSCGKWERRDEPKCCETLCHWTTLE